jgi:N-acetylmuramoyl-L-alanine amidase
VILLEVGFMSNPAESILLANEDYQNVAACGIVQGVEKL